MLSRRELITAGAAAPLAAGFPAPSDAYASPESEAAWQSEREGQREIARSITQVDATLRSALLTNTLAHGVIARIRAQMEQYFRASSKFPDFIEVGVAVFMDVYDWHVRHRQPLTVTRAPDGRYWMQFMFSTLILRGEVDPAHVGIPYDKA